MDFSTSVFCSTLKLLTLPRKGWELAVCSTVYPLNCFSGSKYRSLKHEYFDSICVYLCLILNIGCEDYFRTKKQKSVEMVYYISSIKPEQMRWVLLKTRVWVGNPCLSVFFGIAFAAGEIVVGPGSVGQFMNPSCCPVHSSYTRDDCAVQTHQ